MGGPAGLPQPEKPSSGNVDTVPEALAPYFLADDLITSSTFECHQLNDEIRLLPNLGRTL